MWFGLCLKHARETESGRVVGGFAIHENISGVWVAIAWRLGEADNMCEQNYCARGVAVYIVRMSTNEIQQGNCSFSRNLLRTWMARPAIPQKRCHDIGDLVKFGGLGS